MFIVVGAVNGRGSRGAAGWARAHLDGDDAGQKLRGVAVLQGRRGVARAAGLRRLRRCVGYALRACARSTSSVPRASIDKLRATHAIDKLRATRRARIRGAVSRAFAHAPACMPVKRAQRVGFSDPLEHFVERICGRLRWGEPRLVDARSVIGCASPLTVDRDHGTWKVTGGVDLDGDDLVCAVDIEDDVIVVTVF